MLITNKLLYDYIRKAKKLIMFVVKCDTYAGTPSSLNELLLCLIFK